MKENIAMLLIALSSFSTNAVFAGEADHQSFLRWFDHVPKTGDSASVVMQGETLDGLPCEIVAMKSPFAYLALSVENSKDKNNDKNQSIHRFYHFGSLIFPDESNFIFSENKIRLSSSIPSENETSKYTELDVLKFDLEIELKNGVPVKARGKSGLQRKEQVCMALTS